MNTELETTEAAQPPEKPQSMVARKIAEAKARHQAEIALLNRMASIIDSLPEHIAQNCYIFSDYLDFNSLSREQSLEVISTLKAGKWTKSVNQCSPDTIDYLTEINGVKVRLWAAAPPDSCRVIEVEEATKIVRRKLICSGPEV
jgi:hypothetical protein